MRSALKFFALCLLFVLVQLPTRASIDIAQSVFRVDKPFPEYLSSWSEGWSAVDSQGQPIMQIASSLPLGGYAHIYFRNTGRVPFEVKDVLLDSVSLKEAVAFSKNEHAGYYPASIYFSKLPAQRIERVKLAGEPVWWKIEPGNTIQPGGVGEIVIRLRRIPKSDKINLQLISDEKLSAVSISVNKIQPGFADICFSDKLDTIYLFAVHPKPGLAPKQIFLDGRDVTIDSRIVSDPKMQISPVIVTLREPLEAGDYCLLQAIYPDGSKATAGLRAWGNEMVYGMWGSKGHHREYLPDWAKHNINVQMGMWSGDGNFMVSQECLDLMNSLGMRQMANWYGNARKPIFYFLQDEPDAQDFGYDDIPVLDRLGQLGQPLVEKSITLRKKDPVTPQLLNVDNTFKPVNYYTYAQLADIPCADPYYGVRVGNTSMSTPEQLAFHIKPFVVYASGSIYHLSAAPKPMHLILVSTGPEKPGDGRFPTPEEKQMEVFYALSAGAKGLSYWWFTPEGGGCGGDSPAAKGLYRQIGLLGAQVRTAGPLITKSTPAVLPVQADPKLFTRCLLSGDDTVVLLIVNNDVICDRIGTAVMPVNDGHLSIGLPSWLTARSVFEVTVDGTQPVKWSRGDADISMDLGKIELTRMIILTSDTALKNRLQKLYDDKFASNVRMLK